MNLQTTPCTEMTQLGRQPCP